MSVLVLSKMSIAEDRLAEVTSWLETTPGDCRAHRGCIMLDAYQAKDDPTTIVFVEQFETRADHAAYRAWRRDRGDLDYLEGVMSGTPSVRYVDLVDV